MTYCNGVDCPLKEECERYVDGQEVIQNRQHDTNQYWWIDNCPDQKSFKKKEPKE